jgi:hypothetical protein
VFVKNNFKTIFTTILLGFVVASIAFAVLKEKKQDTESAVKNTSLNGRHHYMAYYFYTTARCPSCLKIEKYSHETLKTKFANEMSSGKILWKMLNVDEAANAHFVQKYSLNTKSVVLSEVNEGKEVKWKNLDQVWDLLGDETKFSQYIESEVRNFITATK